VCLGASFGTPGLVGALAVALALIFFGAISFFAGRCAIVFLVVLCGRRLGLGNLHRFAWGLGNYLLGLLAGVLVDPLLQCTGNHILRHFDAVEHLVLDGFTGLVDVGAADQ